MMINTGQCLGIAVTYSQTQTELKDRGKRQDEMMVDDILSEGWSFQTKTTLLPRRVIFRISPTIFPLNCGECHRVFWEEGNLEVRGGELAKLQGDILCK